MSTVHRFNSALALLALMPSLASAAPAAPGKEAKLVGAVQAAFDERKPAGLSNLTCWDGFSGQARRKQEEAYKLLVEQQGVTVRVELVEADAKGHKDDAPARPNVRVVKRLDVRLIDGRDRKLLGIIGFPVGEKDGKLLLAPAPPAK